MERIDRVVIIAAAINISDTIMSAHTKTERDSLEELAAVAWDLLEAIEAEGKKRAEQAPKS